MLYKIHWQRDVFEDNPGLLAVEEFTKLEDKQMKYIILVCDPSHDNPVRTLPEKQKKEKAIILAGYPLEDGKRPNKNARSIIAGEKPTIEVAIAKFRELHYDEKQDTLETTKALIERNKSFIKEVNVGKTNDKDAGKNLVMANKFQKELPELIEAYQKIESLLNVQINQKPDLGPQGVGMEIVNNAEETTNSELSLIDQVMSGKQS
jgi:hypothetical protein